MVALSWPAVLSALSVVLTLYFLRRVWPYRDRPGGRLFVALVGTMVLWAGTYAVALTVFDPTLRRVLEGPLWLAVNGTSFTFFAFALSYTGRNYLLRSTPVAVVGGLLAASTLVVVTAPIHDLVQTNYAVEPVYGAATVTYDRGPWFFATVVFDYALVTVSVLLLVDTVVSYGQDYRRQAVALALSPVPILLAGLPWLFRIGPAWQLNLTALAFPFHLALDMYALFQARMFVLTPGVRRAGERAAIDDLGTAVLLVDDARRVVTLNAEAERVLGVSTERALATPISDLLGAEFAAEDGETVTIRADGMNRRYAVSASPFTDAAGSRLGRTVVLQDVTREHRREQRLTVLNRVLRHNLRNDLTVVRGHAEIVAGALDDPAMAEHVDTVLDEIDGLVSLGEKARTFEAIAGEDPAETTVATAPLIDDVVGDLRRDHPEATMRVDAPADLAVETDRDLLELALGELVENALVHGGDHPTVTVGAAATGEGGVAITVADDGPGVPGHEVATLSADAESDLEHASGIGLWLVQWSVAAVGADLSFETDNGTTARVSLPARGEAADAGGD
jgi:signal transduction histidine kinase